ncbi:MAG: alkylphosphonate utilization protein [Bdellovibrionales bacterium]|nr:alkylphosphonate utilization protein [Bdellovibrionales bacterium]
MSNNSHCPKCQSENIYEDGTLWVCPECSHEWSAFESINNAEDEVVPDNKIRDAFGTELSDGDSVTVIKELKIKGSSSAVKVGTKVKNIRLVDGGDGHDIACKIDGIGAINLKSEFVRKA